MVEHGGREGLPESPEKDYLTDNDGGIVVDDKVISQERVETEDNARHVADDVVVQPPVVKASKYDPAVYDLDSVEIKVTPMIGKKNGFNPNKPGVFSPDQRLILDIIYLKMSFGAGGGQQIYIRFEMFPSELRACPQSTKSTPDFGLMYLK